MFLENPILMGKPWVFHICMYTLEYLLVPKDLTYQILTTSQGLSSCFFCIPKTMGYFLKCDKTLSGGRCSQDWFFSKESPAFCPEGDEAMVAVAKRCRLRRLCGAAVAPVLSSFKNVKMWGLTSLMIEKYI